MSFIVQRKHLLENMNHFNRTSEFDKEFKKLSKKYVSLKYDLESFEGVLKLFPTGQGKNFIIIYSSKEVKIIKARLACASLRGRSLRVIYAYHDSSFKFMYIEIYFKGDKENEDRERIEEYLKSIEN